MTEIELRVAATEATFARFNGKALKLGSVDCARMLAFQLRGLGHKASVLKGGRYTNEVGARRALMRLGVSSLSEIMDQRFARIAPAAARVGDICCVPGVGDMGDAMQVVLHRGRVLGFLDGVCGELINHECTMAWRVL